MGIDNGNNLLFFHILAILLFNESHSGESLFNLFAKVLDLLCLQWKHKIIGLSTDGAPNMTCYHSGFTTRLANFSLGQALYRVWWLSHQLDLIIKADLKAISDKAGFPFMIILTTIIECLRRQNILI